MDNNTTLAILALIAIVWFLGERFIDAWKNRRK